MELLRAPVCANAEHAADDGCWEYHLEAMENAGSEQDEWRAEFLRMLKERRSSTGSVDGQWSDREL